MAGLVKYMCPITFYLDRGLFVIMSLFGYVSVRLGVVMSGLVNLQSLY